MTKKASFEIGTYVGSCCTLKIGEHGTITILVSKSQLNTLSGCKNYDFHFVDGQLSGTGAGVTKEASEEGEKIEKEYCKDD